MFRRRYNPQGPEAQEALCGGVIAEKTPTRTALAFSFFLFVLHAILATMIGFGQIEFASTDAKIVTGVFIGAVLAFLLAYMMYLIIHGDDE